MKRKVSVLLIELSVGHVYKIAALHILPNNTADLEF